MTDRPCVLGVWLAFLLVSLSPALAADAASEQVRLAAMLRQLDSIDRLAELGASQPPQAGTRYHFDYARLRQDIERIRGGIHDYLAPRRAQPRDPMTLIGDYRRESKADETP
jgi:RAQPRD family integrative conjugative element protein